MLFDNFPGYTEHTKQRLSLFFTSVSDTSEYSEIPYENNGDADTESHD